VTVAILRLDVPALGSLTTACGMKYSYALLVSVWLASLLALSANGSVCSQHCWPSVGKHGAWASRPLWGSAVVRR